MGSPLLGRSRTRNNSRARTTGFPIIVFPTGEHMRIEIHVLQNFAPSNLNRDDTGSPKDADFGGYRRARISSQCQKRAVRDYFAEHKLIPAANRAERTKRLAEAVAKRLQAKGRDQ